jgi:hypothetical protein
MMFIIKAQATARLRFNRVPACVVQAATFWLSD